MTHSLSYEDFLGMCNGMLAAEYVAVDTEADGNDLRDGRGYAQGISISFDTSRGYYLPFRHRFGENLPREWLEHLAFTLRNCKWLIFHNAKFDIVSLRTLGIDISDRPFYDTMLMAHWINENWQSKALDWLGNKLLREGKARPPEFMAWVNAGGWGGVPVDVMAPYAEQDAILTLKLFNKLWPDFDAQGFTGELWEIEQRFINLIIRMENNGIRVDTAFCKQMAEHGRTQMALLNDVMGFEIGKGSQLGNYLLNDLNFPVVKWTQLDENDEPTGSSKPSFDKFAMAIYDEMLEELGSNDAKYVLAFRGWQKSCAGSYEGYPALISPDGRLRPNYKLHGTVTGRMSCEKPNLQQIPRSSQKAWDGKLKSCFIPQPGYRLWEADYSQLELRLGAAYAGVTSLIDEFAKPDSDVFTRMARELGFDRNTTKTLTYTLQYGGGIKRLRNVFKVDAARAAEIRDNYFATYPGFKRITQRAALKAERQGFVRLWTGRRRHFDNPQQESFKAFNSVVQGGAAEIVKRAMIRCGAFADDDCKMLLQVHDSIVFEIKEGLEDHYFPLIREAMTQMPEEFGVNFAIDIHEWGK